MTYKLISTEMTGADDLHEGAQRSRGLHTGYPGVQGRESDNPTSSPKARGKGKSREEVYDKIGNPQDKENKITVTDRQKDVLNERKSELQVTELLDKREELRKEMDDLAKEMGDLSKMLSESGISLPAGRKQAHGRSGVDLAGKTSKTETGKPSPSGGSGSRGERPHVIYVGKHRGDHRAGIWRHAPGYGSFISRP